MEIFESRRRPFLNLDNQLQYSEIQRLTVYNEKLDALNYCYFYKIKINTFCCIQILFFKIWFTTFKASACSLKHCLSSCALFSNSLRNHMHYDHDFFVHLSSVVKMPRDILTTELGRTKSHVIPQRKQWTWQKTMQRR